MAKTQTTVPARASVNATACSLARASPEAAPVSWMVVNLLCLAFSLYLGLYNLYVNSRFGNDNGNDENTQSQAERTTVGYLLWSLVTTVVWIVEVALRTAFPPCTVPSEANNDDNGCDTDNGGEEFRIRRFQQPLHIFEFILALFFFVGSVLDCLHWKEIAIENDLVGEEIDIWISILAYVYMTYETYKTASAKWNSTCHNVKTNDLSEELSNRSTSTDQSILRRHPSLAVNTTPILQDPYAPNVADLPEVD